MPWTDGIPPLGLAHLLLKFGRAYKKFEKTISTWDDYAVAAELCELVTDVRKARRGEV